MMNAGNQGIFSGTKSSALGAGAAVVAAQCPDTPLTVMTEVSRLAGTLDDLHAQIQYLQNALECVLHPLGPETCGLQSNPEHPVPLMDQIGNAQASAGNAVRRIIEIRNRLAL